MVGGGRRNRNKGATSIDGMRIRGKWRRRRRRRRRRREES